MQREVTDPDGIRWTCARAYAALGDNGAAVDAARVEGAPDRFRVVCTPSGGEQSVELELPEGWAEDFSDEQLLRAIDDGRADPK